MANLNALKALTWFGKDWETIGLGGVDLGESKYKNLDFGIGDRSPTIRKRKSIAYVLCMINHQER